MVQGLQVDSNANSEFWHRCKAAAKVLLQTGCLAGSNTRAAVARLLIVSHDSIKDMHSCTCVLLGAPGSFARTERLACDEVVALLASMQDDDIDPEAWRYRGHWIKK